jgi:1,4-alpha-glucan branching enzyme
MTPSVTSPPSFDRIALHRQPHALLGFHHGQLRLWHPGAKELWFELRGHVVQARATDVEGLFIYDIPDLLCQDYRVYHASGVLGYDPYAFWPTFGELDQHLFNAGRHYELGGRMGARLMHHQGVPGVAFTVWAPEARSVSLVGDVNRWDARMHPMRPLGSSGVWELFLPGEWEGMRYKFSIETATGERLLKADPYALAAELRPQTASIVRRVDRFQWTDQEWMAQRQSRGSHEQGPVIIYEVHLGSWRRSSAGFLNYREIAPQLAEYCLAMGFTHVELLPVAEHPLDESWGYQVTGYFAATSRHGTPEDLQWMINHLHERGIGVLLDWVPGHFPYDEHGLARFDGSHCYEHADWRQGYHPHWHTLCFNYGRHEVSNFLIANAIFWLEQMHVDGLRVDAVASMLYLDYGRREGDWLPNRHGGRENLDAIEFLRHLNSIVHQRTPGVLIIAEESTSWAGVSHPVHHGGLGFTHKWNMGWMNDTLRYLARNPFFRGFHQTELTFGMLYAFSENFLLPLSHDEVVHGKRSLLSKMPGDPWQQAANLRNLLAYQMSQPGKKLLFMGGEFGQWDEWNCKEAIHWFLLDFPLHQGIHRCTAALCHLVKQHPALWRNDHSWQGFEWVDFRDTHNSVVAYLRKDGEQQLLVVHHFTPQTIPHYTLVLPGVQHIEELLTTDAAEFGGAGVHNPYPTILQNGDGASWGISFTLPPLATSIFRVVRG